MESALAISTQGTTTGRVMRQEPQSVTINREIMGNENFGQLIGAKPHNVAERSMHGATPHPESIEAIARRLRKLRGALKLTQADMSRAAGGAATGAMWGNYEAGIRLIPPKAALKLCQSFGVTMDWVYRGWEYNVAAQPLQKIRDQED